MLTKKGGVTVTVITFKKEDGTTDYDKIEAFQYRMAKTALEYEVKTGYNVTRGNRALWTAQSILRNHGIEPKRTKKAVLNQLKTELVLESWPSKK